MSEETEADDTVITMTPMQLSNALTTAWHNGWEASRQAVIKEIKESLSEN